MPFFHSSPLRIISILVTYLISIQPLVHTLSINSDKEALISFRSLLNPDPFNEMYMSSWDNRNSSPCNWTGIMCNKFGHRVIGLNLSSLQLRGPISPYIGNLSFLQSLQLQNNKLIGTIPNEVCNLHRLKVLNLSYNFLEGSIPKDLSKFRELQILDLIMNNITGKIPQEIGLISTLQVLNLGKNQISGHIPKSVGNLSSLITLDFGTNSLNGPIPVELSRLTKLEKLVLTINNLTGTVPEPIYNMSSLKVLALASNKLWGELPYNVGETLPNLLVFNFCINNFTGRIPGSLHNLPNIQVIRMAHNQLTGTIPPGLGNLPNLIMYNIGYNNIVSSDNSSLDDFITALANSTQLNFLAFDGNLIEGAIPESIGNLSKSLSKLFMGSNGIHGSIPSSIGQLTGLNLLNMSYNQIMGSIPDEISSLKGLQVLDLANNYISGSIPKSLGNLIKLEQLDLSGNNLVGNLPNTFGGFSKLNSMDLSSNMLNGSIPKEIFNIPISNFLKLSNNFFTGKLPQEIEFLQNAISIDLCSNRLSGNIPSSISNCKSLEMLNLSKNSFSGPIPSSLGNLNALGTLDLSDNQLSGLIPSSLQLLNATLNLSFNDLEGELPCGGVFRNLSRVDLRGNPKVVLHLACPNTHHLNRKFQKINSIIIVLAALVLCFIVGTFLYARRKTKARLIMPLDSVMRQRQLIKYDELRQATEDFSDRNLLGKGGFGSVFKGYLEGHYVAIKVLDMKLAASVKSFVAECEALRSIRHRNLVKLITSCSSLDCKNEEFLALIFEYLSNGSLEDWLQGTKKKENGYGLNFAERLDVIIDVGCGLDYLHHDTEVPVVHCDLKPSNILLDEDMTAKIGDFGLAKLLMEKIDDQHPISESHALKGSIGYMPPEYGMGVEPSTAGDTYSFGVTLLEMFTGRSPSSFTGEQNLVAWVQACPPTEVVQVLLDPELHRIHISEDYSPAEGLQDNMGYLFTVFEVGLSCTFAHPSERITMSEALQKLKSIRSKLLKA